MFIALTETLYPDDHELVLSIYKRYNRIIFSTVKKYVSDACIVEDLVQDAIVNLIQKKTTMQKLSQRELSAYIVFTARNVSINYLKHQQIVNQHQKNSEYDDEIDTEEERYTPSPEEIILINERKEEFYKAFEKLSNKDRDVLIGKYMLGHTDRELAESYGCKLNSIRMVLTRARRNALEAMKKEFINYDET